MSKYQHFIGIGIGKFTFVVSRHGHKAVQKYNNDSVGIVAFLKDFKGALPTSLIVLETTGGYEMELALTLCHHHYTVHRANTRHVKNFIRSFGNRAKTDALDAQALALYGYERCTQLAVFKPACKNAFTLCTLVQRRHDLTQMIAAEKNRAKAPNLSSLVKGSCDAMIKTINEQIALITRQIQALIVADPLLKARFNVLKTVPGIGDITAQKLLALMPELGTLDRRRIASLAGLAPRANDSGTFSTVTVAPAMAALL